VPAATWAIISGVARNEFNLRLKERKIPGGKWESKKSTVLDRLLGQELVALAWACEPASGAGEATIYSICRRWAGMRPEERWWLFRMAANEGRGDATETAYGWRQALYHGLSGK
jgi:hypothetical protein